MVGDGAMQMNGTSELLTIKRYMDRWPDKRLIVMVLHNNDLNQVTWEMRAMVKSPKVDVTQVLPDFDYAAFAELAGLKGLRMLKPEDVGPVWDEALSSNVPVVIDAHTDPEVPPLPPHIEMKQALSMMAALLKGDPRAKRNDRRNVQDRDGIGPIPKCADREDWCDFETRECVEKPAGISWRIPPRIFRRKIDQKRAEPRREHV